jgi:hypothetical protein
MAILSRVVESLFRGITFGLPVTRPELPTAPAGSLINTGRRTITNSDGERSNITNAVADPLSNRYFRLKATHFDPSSWLHQRRITQEWSTSSDSPPGLSSCVKVAGTLDPPDTNGIEAAGHLSRGRRGGKTRSSLVNNSTCALTSEARCLTDDRRSTRS